MAGTVISNISTAVHPMNIHLLFLQSSLFPKQVLLLAAAAESVDVGMLEEQQGRRLLARGDLGSQLVLQVPGLLVFDDAEAENLADSHIQNEAILPLGQFAYRLIA